MKTNEFIVEYAGIGEDAEEMSADHEVQLARQQCYHAARDAIALHHILKDVSEQEGLESWVSEKLTQAASNLNDVIEHLEALRGGDGEEGIGDIMHAFSVESAEKQYAELLGEDSQVNELKLKPEFAGDGEVVDMPARRPPAAATPGVKVTKVGADTYRVSYNGKSIECSRREVPHYKQQIVGEGQVNELDSSTMQNYLQKRKETPTPRTAHKAGNQARGVRSASEKIHDKLVMKHAIAGGDTRVREAEQVDELSQGTLQSYVPKANRSREKATDDQQKAGTYDPKVADKMDRRAEFTMKAKNKVAQPVKEDASAGGTSAGAMAAGVAGAKQGKPGTGKPKELGNKVSRKQVQVGKGIY